MQNLLSACSQSIRNVIHVKDAMWTKPDTLSLEVDRLHILKTGYLVPLNEPTEHCTFR